MTKQAKTTKRVKGTTKGVQVRLLKSSIGWLETKVDEKAPSVPARIRKMVEEAQAAEEAKKAGG